MRDRPDEDAVLIQVSWSTHPLAPFCDFEILPRSVTPGEDRANGVEYRYLTVGESAEFNRGAGPFTKRYEVTYLGQGKATVYPMGRWIIGELGFKQEVETILIPGWDV